MQYNPFITLPAKLGQVTLSSNQNGSPKNIQPYYYEWNSDTPYAGGWGLITCNINGSTSNYGSTSFDLWLTGASSTYSPTGNFDLQTTDMNLYVAQTTGLYQPVLAVTDGSSYSQQSAITNIQTDTFVLNNLGQGQVAIQLNGQSNYVGVNTSSSSLWRENFSFCCLQPTGTQQPFQLTGGDFNILVITGSGIGLDLSGQDLAEGDYIASVAHTHFDGANLSNAVFSNLTLPSVAGCTFTKATLSGADLSGVQDLNQAPCDGAIMPGTNLSVLSLGSTNGCHFSGANLIGSVLSNGLPIAYNFDYSQTDFTSAHLNSADLSNVTFHGTIFTGAHLPGANLSGADLTGANLSQADLTGAHLQGTILTGAILAGTIFTNCDLSTTVFDPNPQFGTSSAEATVFNSATIPVASLGMTWSYVDLTDATLTDCPTSLDKLMAVETIFPSYSSPFAGVSFQGVNFTKANLTGVNLTGCDFNGATLTGATLNAAVLNKSNLSGATLTGATLATSTGDNPVQDDAAKVSNAFLLNTVLDQVQASGVDFTGSYFVTTMGASVPASAIGATMDLTTFDSALIISVNSRGTEFSGASFNNAVLIGSQFPSCAINPSSANTGGKVPTMYKTDLRGTLFADGTSGSSSNPANMDGLNMGGACVSTSSGVYDPTIYTDFYGNTIPIYVNYGATLLGTTTSGTTCPNGDTGPCTLEGGGTDCGPSSAS